jgi:hypothetical protein
MNDLVARLSTGTHPVVVEGSLGSFQQACDRGYAHVRFTGTQGGTELGFRLIPGLSDLSKGHWNEVSGHIKLVGELSLNYARVRCHADIDLATLTGEGRLEPLET